MPTLEFATIPADWPETCNRVFAADKDGRSLAKSLVQRWSENADWLQPFSFSWDDGDFVPYPWAEMLGFAFAQDTFCEIARANVVAGFQAALTTFEPALTKGTVWLEDVLALRHLQYNINDSNVALEAMDIMLKGLEQIPGQFPLNDFAQYQIFHGIYDLATICLIAELREPRLIEASFVAGTRPLPSSHATLFSQMARLAEGGNRRPPGDPRLREFEEWTKRYEHQQQIIDALFDTLNRLNPEFSRCGQFPPNAILSHVRELDLAWFRLAYACSDSKLGMGVADAIRKLRTGNDALFAIDSTELPDSRHKFSDAHSMEVSADDRGEVTFHFGPKVDETCRQHELEPA